MKIRLDGNQWCFRLSRKEMDQVLQGETVATVLYFPTSDDTQKKIKYIVSMDDAIEKLKFYCGDLTFHLSASPAILDQLLSNPSKEGIREEYETQAGIASYALQVDLR